MAKLFAKWRPTCGFQHLRHSGHPGHGQTRNHLETISSHLTIRPNRRFVDDVYLQTTAMNNLHPKVWNWETWNNSQWPFTVTTWFQSYYLQRRQKFLRVLQKKRTAKKPPFAHPRNWRSTLFVTSVNVLKINVPYERQQQSTKTCLRTSSFSFNFPFSYSYLFIAIVLHITTPFLRIPTFFIHFFFILPGICRP